MVTYLQVETWYLCEHLGMGEQIANETFIVEHIYIFFFFAAGHQ